MPDDALRYERYGRYFAVYENDSLLCVAVYKKGALAVIDRLTRAAVQLQRERATQHLSDVPA